MSPIWTQHTLIKHVGVMLVLSILLVTWLCGRRMDACIVYLSHCVLSYRCLLDFQILGDNRNETVFVFWFSWSRKQKYFISIGVWSCYWGYHVQSCFQCELGWWLGWPSLCSMRKLTLASWELWKRAPNSASAADASMLWRTDKQIKLGCCKKRLSCLLVSC